MTEAVTGLDLVELQLRVADGESLAESRVDVTRPRGRGAALRRGSADRSSRSPERVPRLRLPTAIRVDAGVEEGDEVGASYDPMIAKLIAHGADREEALDRLAAALDETVVEGVTTNLPFLRWLVAHPAFRAADLSTDFLDAVPAALRAARAAPPGPWGEGWRLNLPPAPALRAARDRGRGARRRRRGR